MIDEFWRRQAATSPQALAEVLQSDAVLDAIRKEIRRRSGFNADTRDLAEYLRGMVVWPELMTNMSGES